MKTCKHCNSQFTVTDEDLEFYKKIEVPNPTLCPDCRMQRRTAFRNERHLYKRKCDYSGKEILSIYPPTSKVKVYDQSIWWSDKWAPTSYGQTYDFNRPFFDQFNDLMQKVPHINLINRNNENSDYCNDTNDMKNSYLCFNSEFSEDCYYMTTSGFSSRDCLDMFWCVQSELCYECTKVIGGYHSFWCFNCQGISDCYFCQDLQQCKNCFGCVGLRQKEYCIYNEQVSRSEYEEFIKKFGFTYPEIEEAKSKVQELRLKLPVKNLQIRNSENCIGDYIEDSKNCIECFDMMNAENCKYVWDALLLNAYDCFNCGIDSSFAYECMVVYRSNNMKFCSICTGSHDLSYCLMNFFSENCFGCIGLKHKKYCILNKQYTKEEYLELLPKIIDHMKSTGEYGEFFPAKISATGYNNSMAMEYFPQTREESLTKGFTWNDYEKQKPVGIESLSANYLPPSIKDVPENITASVIKCEKDGQLFKIIPQELKFYKKNGIPVPHNCPDCRHYSRKEQINPRKLWTAKCDNCNTTIKTTYSPQSHQKIYCEKCYLEAIY